MEPEKRLRKSSTDAETRLWARLRSSQLGVKFRRQHELAGYIVDFVSVERRLIVELDGSQHLDAQEYDSKRTRCLEALGFRVLRFWNDDVLQKTDDVLSVIATALAEMPPPHPNPLPRQRRGRGGRAALESDLAHVAMTRRGGRAALEGDLAHAALTRRGSRAALESDLAHVAMTRRGSRAALESDLAHVAMTRRGSRAAFESDLAHAAMTRRGGRAALESDLAHAAMTRRGSRAALESDLPHVAMTRRGSRAALESDLPHVAMTRRGSGSAQNSPLLPAQAGGEGWVRGQHDALRQRLELRARLYALIRQFFATRGVLEIETPILSAGANTEPNIASFATRFSGHVEGGTRERWLRTSSEFAQKRLLAAGVGDNYELGRVFRDGEAGRRHNPEFAMLEWYRVGWDHTRLIGETVDLVRNALALVGKSADVWKTTYRDLFRDAVGLDPFSASDAELRAALGDVRVDADGLSRDDWLDLLLTHRIQPDFPRDRITVVFDYPATQCALAKIRADDPPVAERFELYVGKQELANGYHELTDAAEQRTRFVHDNVRRHERGLPELPIDENFLAALEGGLPDCAGVALGIERLLMAMTGSDDIRDVLAFSFAQA